MAKRPEVPLFGLATLCGISHRFSSYPPHQAGFPDIYCRAQISEAASCFLLPFDLHVLAGLPPAFNLSHDPFHHVGFDAQN